MRNLSSEALYAISQRFGSEPITIVGVNWAGVEFLYAERYLNPECPGKLLEISSIEDVTNLQGTSNATNLSILLDDTDGSLHEIFNLINMHKRPVNVYQFFLGLDISQKFLTYEGVIESPIVYSDNDRTLSFSLVSIIEHTEIGFSPEEGQFLNLPSSTVGQAWPMAFGSPNHCPGLTYQYPAVGTTLNPYVALDPLLDNYPPRASSAFTGGSTTIEAIARQSFGQIGEITNTPAFGNSNDLMTYHADYVAAITSGQSGGFQYQDHVTTIQEAIDSLAGRTQQSLDDTVPAPGQQSFIIDGQEYDEHDYYLQITFTFPSIDPNATQFIEPNANQSGYASNPYVAEQFRAKGGRFDGVQLLNNGVGFPVNVSLNVKIGNAVFIGKLDSTGFMHLTYQHLPGPYTAYYNSEQLPAALPQGANPDAVAQYIYNIQQSTEYFYADGSYTLKDYESHPAGYSSVGQVNIGWKLQQGLQQNGYQYFDAGSTVTILGDYSVDYIVSIFPTTVTNVWGYKAVGNTRTLSLVPSDRWKEVVVDFGSGIHAYIVRMNRHLSQYPGESWEDQIYVDQTSSVGPNPTDIMRQMISVYATDLSYDADSFTSVGAALTNYPMNFYIQEKREILAFLQQIAYQCRCALYIKNRTFFLKYLPLEYDAVDTITLDDIIEGSIQVTTTETEQLITRYTGTYVSDYAKETVSQIILRNNIAAYGLYRDSYDYFAYTNSYQVQKSAIYWTILRSNIWKRIKFATPLTKLNLETFDDISFAIPGHVAIMPVTCRIESTQYDITNNRINFECWVPVLLGQMTQYPFAYPGDNETDYSPLFLNQFDANYYNEFIMPPLRYIAAVPGQQSNSTQGSGLETPINAVNNPLYTLAPYDIDPPIPTQTGDGELPIQPRGQYIPLTSPIANAPTQASKPIPIDAASFVRIKPLKLVPKFNGSVPGRVVSGSGAEYKVEIYPNGGVGTDGISYTVTCTQLQIAEKEQIPPKTAVLVSQMPVGKDGDYQSLKTRYEYYMQVPVWIGNP